MDVRSFYNKFPYPAHTRPINWAEPYKAYCTHTPRRILHAGCATGSQTCSLAHVFPQAEVLGLDFSEQPLKIAKELATEAKLPNIWFDKHDLVEPLDKYGKFDLIVSYGVLHHIPEIDNAVENISKVLEDKNSPFFIFVYGKYGKAVTKRVQEALAIWQRVVPDLSREEEKAALQKATRATKVFSGKRGIGKRLRMLLSPTWRHAFEIEHADALLHPYVRYFDFESILALCDRHNLRFANLIYRSGHEQYTYPKNENSVLTKYSIAKSELVNSKQKREIVDRLSAPEFYEFICYKTTK